jgi:hypothetical protein
MRKKAKKHTEESEKNWKIRKPGSFCDDKF